MNLKEMLNHCAKWFEWRKGDPVLEEKIQSGDEIIVLSSDTRPAIRMAFWIVFVAFGGFLLWAWLAPLDEGATSTGTVVVEYKRRPIQHMTGGIAEEVLIKDGQAVTEGQVLIRLSQTNVRSQVEIFQTQIAQLTRQISATKPKVDEGYFPLINYQQYVRDRDEAVLRLKMAQAELDRTEIKSPIPGTVISLNITKGAVVSPGVKLMEIVPSDEL